MEKLKTAFLYAGLGIAVGSVTSTVSIACMNGIDSTMKQVLVWQAVSALFGLASWLICADFWNLLVRTVIHFVLCFTIAVTTGTFLGYSGSWISSARDMFPAFLLIYVVIYAVMFWVTMNKVKKMNQKLQGQ